MTFSVLFVDRPVERLVVSHVLAGGSYWLQIFDAMAVPSLIPLPAACVYLVIYTLRRVAGRPEGRYTNLLITLAVATAVATVEKEELKAVIGRPWPGTWTQYGLWALQPFADNYLYGGFPSGHTAYIAAPMFILWWRVPQYRALWLAIVLAVMIGLVGSGHHFVADVIAGFFLGLAAAAGTLALGPRQPARQR